MQILWLLSWVFTRNYFGYADFPQFLGIHSSSVCDVVNLSRDEIAVFEELEAFNVIRLWFSKDGLPSGLGALQNLLHTMGDSFILVFSSGNVGGESHAQLCSCCVQLLLLQQGYLFGHFNDVMVQAAGQIVDQTADLYDI